MREHPIVSVYTPNAEYHYRVFAAVDWSRAYLPAQFDYFSPTGLRSFLDAVLAAGGVTDDTVFWTTEDRFLILSTCATSNTSRFLVVAYGDGPDEPGKFIVFQLGEWNVDKARKLAALYKGQPIAHVEL